MDGISDNEQAASDGWMVMGGVSHAIFLTCAFPCTVLLMCI